MRNPSTLFVALVTLAIAPGLSQAAETPQVVFSTLTGIGGYDNNAGIRISGASAFPQGYEAYACQFVPSATGKLFSIELGVAYSPWAGPESQIDVRLSLATGGLPLSTPALTIGTVTTSTVFGAGGLTTFTAPNDVNLLAGTAYWLTVLPHSDTTASTWCNPSSSISGTFGFTSPFGPGGLQWYMGSGAGLKAFQVSVVPEPATVALLALGGIFVARRRAQFIARTE